MRQIHRHMDTEEAERYLLGDSPDPEAAELEEHLLICAECRERISETEVYLSSMRDAAEEVRAHPGDTDWCLAHRFSGVAAGAAIAGFGLIASRYDQNYQTPVEVRLVDSTSVTAPAGRGLDLRFDRGGARLEIVNAAAQTAWRGALAAGNRAVVPGQRSGTYLVRMLSASGELRHEYRLEIR